MDFIRFRERMFSLVCFTTNQIEMHFPEFNRNNLTRWTKRGWLIRLRQGLYTFPEYKITRDYVFFFANKIYQPSYISLHTALSFYGAIPESVVQVTNVTTLKTATFKNTCGEFSYKSVNESLFWGYELKTIAEGLVIKFARVEKALLDLLYLYPFYNTGQEMLDLRFDGDFLNDRLNKQWLLDSVALYKNKALEKRLNLFLQAYKLL